MVKVSITLPNKAQITFESEEPEIIHQIVQMALRDLPRDLMLAAPSSNGGAEESGEPEKSNKVTATPPVIAVGASLKPASTEPVRHTSKSVKTLPSVAPQPQVSLAGEDTPTTRDTALVQFCQSVNPLGDMRRVVVAIEGARRFLNREGVDTELLGRLFDLAGWRRPPNFVQTLRNAARSKFRWLERIPGRSGQYTVTELGRSTILGS